jgi:hypothetical protein
MRRATALCATVGIVLACAGTSPVTAVGADRAVNRFTVTAKVSDAEPMKGDKVVLRGEVSPARPGEVVKLQLRYGTSGAWKTTGTDKLNRKSKYKFVDELSTVRFRQYRVVKPADGNRKLGRSPKVGVTVYGWRDLTSLTPAAQTGMFEKKSVTINAIDYPSSLMAFYGNGGSIDYNLNRGCKTIEGRYGLDDSSASTSTGTVALEADSAVRYTGTFGLTQSQFAQHDVRGVFRITIRWTSSNTAGTPEDQSGAHVAVGSPRVLCSF